MLAKVLIVEDNPVNLIILKKILSTHCSTDSAKNGAKAMELLEANQYDLVLTDINLGDEEFTGIDVLKKIRSNPAIKNMPVIAVSAYFSGADSHDFLKEDFTALVVKPVSEAKLLAAISPYLL